jgi:chemotaxis regulatin CheY-phosphate phosphatase CheZ
MTDNISSITTNFATFQEEITKFMEKDNASAAARARKALLEIGKLTRTLRKQIQERKKDLKAKA